MEFRKAVEEDIPAFVKMRLEFALSIRNLEDPAGFEKSTEEYLKTHLGRGDTVIFVAVEGGEIVSSCMACLFKTAPLPSCLTGSAAELLNVYTRTAYRRRGLAEKLLGMLLEELRGAGVEKVLLEYTDMGFALYEKAGFAPLGRQMQLRL